jgi:phenol 2-monooxygenase
MLIPRENDKVRLYIQLSDEDVIDPNTGRVDKEKIGPTKIFEVEHSISPVYHKENLFKTAF